MGVCGLLCAREGDEAPAPGGDRSRPPAAATEVPGLGHGAARARQAVMPSVDLGGRRRGGAASVDREDV